MKRMTLAVIVIAVVAAGAAVPVATPIVVRSTEIDINGHVNNAKAVEYLQWGRWDWLGSKGFGRERFNADGSTLVVVHLDINYRREMKEGDALLVTTVSTRLGGKSFDVHQEICRDGNVMVDATVTMVVIDRETRKAREIPIELANAIRP